MTEKPQTLFRVYEEPHDSGSCSGCGAALDWYETLNGKRMPVNGGSVPVKSEKEGDSFGRVVVFFDGGDAHWATCPQRDLFKRTGGRP